MIHSIDFATGKRIDISQPEEQVRQEYERVLVEGYGYFKSDLDIEVTIPIGTGHVRSDIVVYDDSGSRDPAENIIGIVEVKRESRNDGIDQLKSYMTATSTSWGVWTNGNDIAYLSKEGAKVVSGKLNNIPVRGQLIEDVGRLEKKDLKPFTQSELKSAFRRILNTLYANADIGRRDRLGNEMMKIIFSKLHDERTFIDNPPEFRVQYGEDPSKVAARVNKLFQSVRDELNDDGVFDDNEKITLDPSSLAWVVGQLERGSLLNTDSDVVGDAFEVFSESKFIGEKGEFFTPRGIIKIAVKLADPEPSNTICDPACGSGGFLIHAMKHIWEKMENHPKWKNTSDIRERKKEMAARSFFGIDKEIDLVKIAKAHMAIAGDGRSNIVHHNSLNSTKEFDGDAKSHFVKKSSFNHFDVILTNPPFGTKTKVSASKAGVFKLGKKWSKRKKSGDWIAKSANAQRDPYILFIERCMDFMRGGGGHLLSYCLNLFFTPHPLVMSDSISWRVTISRR